MYDLNSNSSGSVRIQSVFWQNQLMIKNTIRKFKKRILIWKIYEIRLIWDKQTLLKHFPLKSSFHQISSNNGSHNIIHTKHEGQEIDRLTVFRLRSALTARPKAMILRSKTTIITSFEAIILGAKKILEKLFRNGL